MIVHLLSLVRYFAQKELRTKVFGLRKLQALGTVIEFIQKISFSLCENLSQINSSDSGILLFELWRILLFCCILVSYILLPILSCNPVLLIISYFIKLFNVDCVTYILYLYIRLKIPKLPKPDLNFK